MPDDAPAGADPGAARAASAPAALADILIGQRRLSPEAMERARRLQAESGEKLDTVLTRLGILSEAALAEALAEALHLPLLAAASLPKAPILADRLSPRFLRHHRVLPVAEEGEAALLVATADPLDPYPARAIAFATGRMVRHAVAAGADIDAALDRLHAAPEARAEGAGTGGSANVEDSERLRDLASEAPVVRIVNALIGRAVEARASDIHMEPTEDRLRVRLRVDGVLQEIGGPPPALRHAVVSRIKIMAKLNIAERRLSQDGRLRFAVRGQEVDFRVSTTPVVHGESVVLRILDRGSLVLEFPALGFAADVLPKYLDILHRPHGVMLVTGPTGSGKTTTLYTSLMALNTPERKILTIEDPVEYQLQGINQTQVKPQIGLTFGAALRSFLRQDPDIMMVGEIRDLETAQIAVQAALTGHMILSTLHTNDAASAVTRLLDMGLEPFLLTSTLNAVVGQRLVRTLCPHCRRAHAPGAETIRALGLEPLAAQAGHAEIRLYEPVGCARCHGGFRGRSAIIELLPMSEGVARLVLSRAEARAIGERAETEGMRSMFADGMLKALAGQTTPDEVLRVTRDA
jgi:general secretion pathway protein E